MPGLYAPVSTSALFRRLDYLGRSDLQARVTDFRSRLDTYLRGVHSTFSHYTSHAVDHSDQIVRELSSLLYAEPSDQKKISYDLNAMETYLLLLAAYAHDSGMVVTDAEKFRVLGSDAWADFVRESPMAAELVELRATILENATSPTADQARFAQELELRYLLADFFRRQHAQRSALAVAGSLRVGPDFLDDDPAAAATLATICEGHGLNRAELASQHSFPMRRDIFGQPVNVRFLAIMLRLGDLLDMRSDRACPLLQSLASPMPESSEVHWTQYQRIVSRVTSPEVIELRAECKAADEHRLLQDWCQWLVEEVHGSSQLLLRAGQHDFWTPPRVSMGVNDATIQICRAVGARYRAEDWRFTLDHNEIVSRLVKDVHRHPLAFIRELLQNALDAARARAYSDSGEEQPYPNLLSSAIREAYGIEVQLKVDDENRVVEVTVADKGLGMTDDIVKNYLLQIGRSWYVSRQFRERFRFLPTSRFGIGFLSVFAASADVKVVTRWHEWDADRALSMRLRGPRNYLLFEDDARPEAGTSVSVKMSDPPQLEEVLRYVSACCVANEFSVTVSVAHPDGDPEVRAVLPGPQEGANWRVEISEGVACRTHRVESTTPGVFGFVEFLVLEEDGRPDDWSVTVEDLERLSAKLNPAAVLPALPPSWIAANGLASEGAHSYSPHTDSIRWQLDARVEAVVADTGLARQGGLKRCIPEGALGRALDEHLRVIEGSPRYRADLLSKFGPLLQQWRMHVAFISRVSGNDMSMREVLQLERVRVAFRPRDGGGVTWPRELSGAEALRLATFEGDHADGVPIISPRTASLIRYATFHDFAGLFTPTAVSVLDEGLMVADFDSRPSSYTDRKRGEVVPFTPEDETVAVTLPTEHVVFNELHPFVVLLNGLPEPFAAARGRVMGRIVRWYERGESLASLIGSVADMAGNPGLARFAKCLRDEPYRWLDGSFLRLPIDRA